MSKVLVMPGSPEFEQTAKVIDLKCFAYLREA